MTAPEGQAMRVLHVLGSGQIGGIERVAHDLCEAQLASGEVVPSVLFWAAKGPFVETFRSLGIQVTDAGADSGLFGDLCAMSRVRRAGMASDVIHLHGFIPAMVPPLVLSHRPIVFHEHGVFGQGRPATLTDRLKHRLKGWFLRHCVSVVAANSRFTARWATERYRMPEQQVVVVYNGISVRSFQTRLRPTERTESGVRAPLVVGAVGRLAGFKRFDRLLRAAALSGPGVERLLLVGGGPQQEALIALADELGIADAVEFAGPVRDVPSYLAKMDLFVLPSCDEPFGLVVVEALAAGLPVVVFADAGGPMEILDQLECGSVVGDEVELASIIREAVESGTLPKTCSQDQIEQAFGATVMASRFVTLYRQVVHGGHLGVPG